MDVAAIRDKRVLSTIADPEETRSFIRGCARSIRAAIGKPATITINTLTKTNANALRLRPGDESAGRDTMLVLNSRPPTLHLAIVTAINVSRSRGTAKAVARPKSYRAANA